MALFGKLFEKKECSVCGGEIGLLGNRKLEDGNLCKKCAAKLSPWFDDRRHSTIEQIKEQLAYREENKKVLDHFSPTKDFGESTKLYVDEDHHQFLVAKTSDYRNENADVMDIAQITSCEVSISEMTNEEKREVKDEEGKTKKVSYDPPRYTYSYDFTLKLHVNHPYIDDINFRLNKFSVEVNQIGKPQLGRQPGKYDKAYQYYEQMGQEIKQILTMKNVQTDNQQEAAGTTEELVTCPYCGHQVHAAKECELCGAPLDKS